MSNNFVWRERIQQLHKLLNRNTQGRIRLSEMWPYVLVFLISMQLREFRVTRNATPKMVKNSASTNKMSHNFEEHVK